MNQLDLTLVELARDLFVTTLLLAGTDAASSGSSSASA
jgi:hypothetical protein